MTIAPIMHDIAVTSVGRLRATAKFPFRSESDRQQNVRDRSRLASMRLLLRDHEVRPALATGNAKKSAKGGEQRARDSFSLSLSIPGVFNMADRDYDIKTLNSLIATTLDSVDGYTEAAKDIENQRYGTMFVARAKERRQVVSDLQGEVRRLGGNPEDDGTVLAGAHRMFLDLKATVTGQDDKAIINEVERGEDHIKAKFDDAVVDNDLSPETRDAIQKANQSVQQGHDQMRDLKHALEA